MNTNVAAVDNDPYSFGIINSYWYTYMTLTTPFGVTVQMRGYSLDIQIPAMYVGAVEGICGNFDQTKTNDYFLRDGSVLPYEPNHYSNSMYQMQNDWVTGGWTTTSGLRSTGTNGPPPGTVSCGMAEAQAAKDACDALFAGAWVAQCLSVTDHTPYLVQCYVDFCPLPTDDTLRDVMGQYVDNCKANPAIDASTLCNWLVDAGLASAVTCAPNSHWEGCIDECLGTYSCDQEMSGAVCPPSAAESKSMCVCDTGYFLKDGACVPRYECMDLSPLSIGTCYSGNWTTFMNQDGPADGVDDNTFAFYSTGGFLDPSCTEISAAEVRFVSDPTKTQTNHTLTMSPFEGISCNDVDNPGYGCVDYEVRFCCEGCCPLLNVSGDPELTEYYENYPGIYELTTDKFNDAVVYRQIGGYDDVGNVVYAEGHIYYWEDVGWLIGANTFTYSYYSDGIGDRCPQFAPKNWTNHVFGTQLNVECLAIYPSCNDVDCQENEICTMREEGPVCICPTPYEKSEFGTCETPEGPEEYPKCDGDCDCVTDGYEFSAWLDADDAENCTEPGAQCGDWEMLRMYPQMCSNPAGIVARPKINTTDLLITHIDKDLGFWCSNSEQKNGAMCTDFEVKFCCPKWKDGSDCSEEEYGWTGWLNQERLKLLIRKKLFEEPKFSQLFFSPKNRKI